MKTILIIGIFHGLMTSSQIVWAQSPVTNEVLLTADYLNDLSEELRTNHPALHAARARSDAAQANVQTIRTWEDPMARVGGMAAQDEMRADDGDLLYGIEQRLPLFGKPKLARRVASAGSAIELANAEYQFQQLRASLAQVAFRAALNAEVIAIGEEDLVWLNLMIQSVESKYRSGQAGLTDLIQLQNEQSKRATLLQTDRDQLGHEQVSLNRLLNRAPGTLWPTLKLPALAGPVLFNQRLVDFATKYEPKVLMMQQQIAQAGAMVDLTRRERLPNVNLGVEARNYSGNGNFRQGMVVLSMNLPWGNARKYRHEIKRDQLTLAAAEMDLADYRAGLREEVHQLTVKIDAARREALLYRDQILPRTASALESSRANWEANRGSIRDLLDARRMLLEARLMCVRAVSEQYQMMSDLVLCCGIGDFNALQMIGAELEPVPETTK
jgi:outer membrane protein TolC